MGVAEKGLTTKQILDQYAKAHDLDNGSARVFQTGATRDTATDKFDYEGFYEPTTFDSFAAYMHKHRKQSDGGLRASDNWQKGIPREVYMKSAWRHFIAMWRIHRGLKAHDERGAEVSMEDSANGLLFNVRGYLYEWLRHSRLSGVPGQIHEANVTSPLGGGDQAGRPALHSSHNDTPAAPEARVITFGELYG